MTDDGLADTVALVPGAARALGSASARLLAARGARLVLTDLDAAGLEKVAAGLPGEAVCVPGDVASEADVDAAVAAGVEEFGRIDRYHLNAGIPGPLVRLPDLTAEVVSVDGGAAAVSTVRPSGGAGAWDTGPVDARLRA